MAWVTKKTLIAGQPGTKKYVQIYGDQLVAVRHKYDDVTERKRITVELVVDERVWHKRRPYGPDDPVYIRIDFGEIELGVRVRQAGGVWDRKKKLWQLPYRDVLALELEERIVKE